MSWLWLVALALAQSPAVTSGSAEGGAPNVRDDGTVRLEGIPEVDPALFAEVRLTLQARNASLGGLADDGKSMIVATRFGNTAQLHRVDMPLGARNQLTFTVEPTPSGSFIPGSRDVTFSRDVGGNEQFQIWRMAPSGVSTLLTDGKSRHEAASWSVDGSRLAFNSTGRNGKDLDLWLSDGKTAASAKLAVEREGSWTPGDWSPSGKEVLVQHGISALVSEWWIWSVDDGQIRRLTPETPVASYGQAEFTPDGTHVIVAGDQEGEFSSLYQVELASGAWKPLTADIPWDVEGFSISPSGRTIAYTVNEDGYSSLHLYDRKKGRDTVANGLPKGIYGGVQYAREADVIGLTISGPTLAADAYTWVPKTGELTRWTQSELAGMDPAKLVAPELIRYQSFDGKQIPAFYYKPPGDGPFPVVMSIHGGPEAQTRPYLSALVQSLVARGVAVVLPNVRGSTGYGKSWLAADDGFLREDSVKDIGALLDWIGTRPELDAKRVGVSGGSYGGFMSLATLTRYPDRVKAGVDVVGIANFVTFLENTSPYRQDLRRVEYGDERDPKMREFLVQTSPLTQVGNIRSALFVAHGANDPRVPVSEAEQIVAAVRESGHPAWYFLARNEGHGFRKLDNIERFTTLQIQFFLQEL